MKKIENNFAVTGFVAKDAEVRQFTTTSVARFPLAVARFFVAKLVCRRARPDGLDQWRIAQIFLYRACGLGLRLQNKEYLCAILGAALYCTYFYAP
jgi:hypothetical protein